MFKMNFLYLKKLSHKFKSLISESLTRSCCCCRIKADRPLMGPGPVGEVPSMGIFLRDPRLYLREFRRKPLKTQ